MSKELYLARDRQGHLYRFDSKPIYDNSIGPSGPLDLWTTEDESRVALFCNKYIENLFPEVTFENSPQKIILMTEKELNKLKNFKS